jgi:hypothetical protein
VSRGSRVGHIGKGVLLGAGKGILAGELKGGRDELDSRVTVNLEEMVLHEQKLESILEVSQLSHCRIYETT